MNKIFEKLPGCFSDFDDEYSCGNGAYMLTLEGCDEGGFYKYASALEADGFSLYASNTIEDNIYNTYTGKDICVHLYFVPCERKARVIADPFTALYDASKQDTERVTETEFYQFEVDHSRIDCGMCYIVRCCDGSFFIIDSAHIESIGDDRRIIDFLRAVSPDGKVVINGWYFSHAHIDHIGKFNDFLRYNSEGIRIEALYYNFIDPSVPDSKYWEDDSNTSRLDFDALVSRLDGTKKVKLHSGQKFYVRNLCFTVLCTHEDVYPGSLRDFNNTSTVLLLEAEGTKIMIPGDASDLTSLVLTSRFTKKTLKCDIAQQAHHGHNGTSCEFYSMVNAATILFPTTQIKYDEEYTHYEANRVAVNLADECFIASNGTVGFKLPYKVGEAEIFADETFEDFYAIRDLWGYEYTDEYKDRLAKEFEKRHASGRRI